VNAVVKTAGNRVWLMVLQNAPLLLFVAVLAVFGCLSPKFLTPANLVNVLIQSSSLGWSRSG